MSTAQESAVKKLGRFKVAFTPTMETELVKHIKEMESMLFGFTGAQLRKIAFQFAILDGHKTHTNNLPCIEMARKNHVIVLCIPPHCSHRMQPLDESFMNPLMTCSQFSTIRSRTGCAITLGERSQPPRPQGYSEVRTFKQQQCRLLSMGSGKWHMAR